LRPQDGRECGQKNLAAKREQLGQRYDQQFRVVFDAIRQLMAPPERAKK